MRRVLEVSVCEKTRGLELALRSAIAVCRSVDGLVGLASSSSAVSFVACMLGKR
jgi:hypothetical protein